MNEYIDYSKYSNKKHERIHTISILINNPAQVERIKEHLPYYEKKHFKHSENLCFVYKKGTINAILSIPYIQEDSWRGDGCVKIGIQSINPIETSLKLEEKNMILKEFCQDVIIPFVGANPDIKYLYE